MTLFLSENCEGGTAGATLTGAETIFQAPVGTGAAPTFTTDAIEGSLALRVAPAGGHTSSRVDFAARSTLWITYYVKPNATSSSNTAVINGFLTTTKVFDFRSLPDGAWQLRSVSADRYTSPPLATGQHHRISLMLAPNGSGTGTCRMRVYSGASLHALTPTLDSGDQNLDAIATGIDNLRLGALSADTTLDYTWDRLHLDDATEPAPMASGNTAPTVDAGPDQVVDPYDTVTVTATSSDPDGTIVDTAWTSTPTVTLTGTGASRTFQAPATLDGTVLTLEATVTDDDGATASDSLTVTVAPHNRWRVMEDGSLAPVRASRVMEAAVQPQTTARLLRATYEATPATVGGGFGVQTFGTSPFGGTP